MGFVQKVAGALGGLRSMLFRPNAGGLARARQAASRLREAVTIVDVGCRWGFADAWSVLGRCADVVGFDPDAEECARLQRPYSGPCRVRYVPVPLADRPGQLPLCLTENAGCCSIYPPDARLTETLPELACARLRGSTRIPVTTLDAWTQESGTERVDFLKLDTQGSELLVLRDGQRTLERVRAIECEVEFNPIYVGQPLFGDVDAFLRVRGFVLWRLTSLAHYSPEGAGREVHVPDRHHQDSRSVTIRAGGGQLLWAHACSVRAEAARRGWNDRESALRDGCIPSVLGFGDLGEAALRHAERLPA